MGEVGLQSPEVGTETPDPLTGTSHRYFSVRCPRTRPGPVALVGGVDPLRTPPPPQKGSDPEVPSCRCVGSLVASGSSGCHFPRLPGWGPRGRRGRDPWSTLLCPTPLGPAAALSSLLAPFLAWSQAGPGPDLGRGLAEPPRPRPRPHDPCSKGSFGAAPAPKWCCRDTRAGVEARPKVPLRAPRPSSRTRGAARAECPRRPTSRRAARRASCAGRPGAASCSPSRTSRAAHRRRAPCAPSRREPPGSRRDPSLPATLAHAAGV